VLALGMLTCVRKALDLVLKHRGRHYTMATIPSEDEATYKMIQRGEVIGVFQIESRAQMAMLPRLKPETFYDLVIEVAIVRPGPIQGGMVHPYLRRRQGKEPVDYPSDALRNVLQRTLGVPLFQEQVMRIAMEAAGYTPGQADQLRRDMAAWKRHGGLEKHREALLAGMARNHYTAEFAERIFEQIKGFGDYGFPESHAASFALITYVSSWIKCHEQAAFSCALLNSLPMGFYQPPQLVADARRHGIEVRPVDVTVSDWDCTLEEKLGSETNFRPTDAYAVNLPENSSLTPISRALRLGFNMVAGLSEGAAQRIVEARRARPFASSADLAHRAALDRRDLRCLAEADALAPLAGHRLHTRCGEGEPRDRPGRLARRALHLGAPAGRGRQ